MSDCFICKKPLGNIKVITVKARGVKTLLDRAKAKNDLDKEQFLQTVSEISVHIACYQYYSDSRTDNAVRRLSSSSSSSAVSELVETDFDFVHNCFICGEAFQDESHLRQNRQRRICEVRNEGTKKSIMDLIHKRTDHEAKVIADRIANVPCLVNVKARYHNDCSKQLYSKKWWDKKKSDVRKNDIDNAMEYVFTYLNENSEECQFLLADLMQSIKGDYIPERRTIVERLKVKYGEEILFFNETGQDCIVCFKGFIYKVITKRPSHKKNDHHEQRLQKIRDAAAIILEDIRSQPYETKQYPPSDDFLRDVHTSVPETLSVLLSGIICQSKRKSLLAAQRKCTSIAHSIIFTYFCL